ncbi:transglutaminase domain-containing protein [Spirochaetota bacterium]
MIFGDKSGVLKYTLCMNKYIPSLEDGVLDKNEIQAVRDGRFSEAKAMLLDKAEKKPALHKDLVDRISLLDRIRQDYCLSEEQIFAGLKKELPDITKEEMQDWTRDGSLEAKMIDGEPRYFERAIVNLFRLSPAAMARKKAVSGQGAAADPGDPERVFDMNGHMSRALEAAKLKGAGWHEALNIYFELTLSLRPKSVPQGEVLRCWLPRPQLGAQHSNYRLVSSGLPALGLAAPGPAKASAPGSTHASLYMEAPSNGPGEELLVSIVQSFDTAAFVSMADPYKVEAYKPGSDQLESFLREEAPHIVFSQALRSLAAEITASETNPYLKAKRIFYWFNEKVTYTAAPEYSTIPAISEYCLARRRGDCGIQSLLFIALCRASGIPARWQSGWTLAPGKINLHDWAMFYVEPYGWLHADPSRGLGASDDTDLRWFYFGNIDAYRMVVNEGYGAALEPAKKHLRSETVDFQRGEAEWNGGNLYFDEWDYRYKVAYREAVKV